MSQWDELREQFCPFGWTLERIEPGSQTWRLSSGARGYGEPMTGSAPHVIEAQWDARCEGRAESLSRLDALVRFHKRFQKDESPVREWALSLKTTIPFDLLHGVGLTRVTDQFRQMRIAQHDARGTMRSDEFKATLLVAMAKADKARLDRVFRAARGGPGGRKVL